MKVILINGSPHVHGSTYTMLCEVEKALQQSGVETEILHIGADVPGCTGCFRCSDFGRCIKDDIVNRASDMLAQADGMIIGSPVYFASINGTLSAFLDRLYASGSHRWRYKPCGCFVVARRGGTTAALDALNKYPLINEQPLVSSCYWGMAYGNVPEEVRCDAEGIEIAQTLGRNMAWMVKALRAAQESGVQPPNP